MLGFGVKHKVLQDCGVFLGFGELARDLDAGPELDTAECKSAGVKKENVSLLHNLCATKNKSGGTAT